MQKCITRNGGQFSRRGDGRARRSTIAGREYTRLGLRRASGYHCSITRPCRRTPSFLSAIYFDSDRSQTKGSDIMIHTIRNSEETCCGKPIIYFSCAGSAFMEYPCKIAKARERRRGASARNTGRPGKPRHGNHHLSALQWTGTQSGAHVVRTWARDETCPGHQQTRLS